MRAVVTGEAGFVGRHMRAALEARGWMVEGLDLANGRDARDFFRVCHLRFDLVVHCAAYVGGRAGIDNHPLYLAATDLQLDGALFDWALRTRPDRVVYFSSSAAYPAALQADVNGPCRLRETDIDHDRPMLAESSYGMVKLVGEQLAAMANEAGIRTHVFRPFSGYGVDQSPSYPFPAFVQRAHERHAPFTIWSDGRQIRDWIHIDDIVAAVLACIDHDIVGPINLCTGRGIDFTELARIVTQAAGYSPDLDYRLDAPRGVAYRVGDPTRLHEVYTPKITVEDGVVAALREMA